MRRAEAVTAMDEKITNLIQQALERSHFDDLEKCFNALPRSAFVQGVHVVYDWLNAHPKECFYFKQGALKRRQLTYIDPIEDILLQRYSTLPKNRQFVGYLLASGVLFGILLAVQGILHDDLMTAHMIVKGATMAFIGVSTVFYIFAKIFPDDIQNHMKLQTWKDLDLNNPTDLKLMEAWVAFYDRNEKDIPDKIQEAISSSQLDLSGYPALKNLLDSGQSIRP